MFDREGYLGFTFAGHHSSEYGLTVVSDGSRYHRNLSGSFSDTVLTVPGRNGGYYFGTQIGMHDFDINCAFDDITTQIMNKIQSWLYPNKVGWLIYDEMPYKKYLVKISGVITPNFIPFDKQKISEKYNIYHEILKGELSIPFFSFNEYGIKNEDYNIGNIEEDSIITQQMIDSGLIPDNYVLNSILLSNQKVSLTSGVEFNIYNAGDGISEANFYFYISSDDIGVTLIGNEQEPIIFYNEDDGQSYIIQDFKEEFNESNIEYFHIEILGKKKEIWCTGCDSNYLPITERKNIGAYFNHYFPKIHHVKPTELIVATQSIDENNNTEPLFYPFSYNENDIRPSDTKNGSAYQFEEFKEYWSDYMVSTKYHTYEINSVITPATLFTHLQGFNRELEKETLLYLIYPNKFIVNKNLINFIPIYDDTYI